MRTKKIGYSYWGFLSDCKLDKSYNHLSTPDGNGAYSWAIIDEFQKRGYSVIGVFPNRDVYSYKFYNENAFSSWAKRLRDGSYNSMIFCNFPESYNDLTKEMVFKCWNDVKLYDCDFILHEWRMPIPNRNLLTERHLQNWQPDLFLQECLISYCKLYNIKLLVWDLDYTLTEDHIKTLPPNYSIIDIGMKWITTPYKSIHTTMPLNFDFYNEFPIQSTVSTKLVYVGNRYERDWCIDKYIPEDVEGIDIYGNWTEGGRDSVTRWPKLNFKSRIQQTAMYKVYSKSLFTILLGKRIYLDNRLMTLRLGESMVYGIIPLFIEEYGEDVIKRFAGKFAKILTVSSKNDVLNKFTDSDIINNRKEIITYLRKRIGEEMSVKHFISDILVNV